MSGSFSTSGTWHTFQLRLKPNEYPLAGHAGWCDKVMIATWRGDTTGRCTCGKVPQQDISGNEITGP